MIYEFCLVVEDAIEPYPPKWATIEDNYVPAGQKYPNLTALLKVNNLVGAEAQEILYSRNNWRVPVVDTLGSPTIFNQYPELFRSITMAFDSRDLPGAVRAEVIRLAHRDGNMSEGARAREVHTVLQREMTKIWDQARLLCEQYMEDATTITIDIENLACPSGCCRSKMFRRAAPFHASFLINVRPKNMAKRAKRGG